METIERLMLQHLHPTKLILEVIGIMWAVYFLWNQNWLGAVVAGLGLPLLGSILTMRVNTDQFRKSSYARLVLIHAHPINMLLHIVGAVIAVYGIWRHDTVLILTGVSVITLGHAWGWKSPVR